MKKHGMTRRTLAQNLTAGFCIPSLFAQDEEMTTDQCRVGETMIEVTFRGGPWKLPKPDMVTWVRQCGMAVAGYYGMFPVPRARVMVTRWAGQKGIRGGVTHGEGGARTRIMIGENATPGDLREDWMMTHEFVHYAFPDMPDKHHWIEEGIATYVEPIARVRNGTFDAATAWMEIVRDMPQGQPDSSNTGLDGTKEWGRLYWGGAMFCLVADVRIRKATNNRKGLRDSLRAILNAGGNIETNQWTLEKALETGDRATGSPVLMTLYREMGLQPMRVDLDGMWRDLGIVSKAGKVTFDDGAPSAAIRKAIL